MKKIILWLAAGLFLILPQAQAWEVDPHHSGVMFEIKHIYSAVRGQFTQFSGTIDFDPRAPEKGRFDFEVSVDSINTQIPKRDQHLRSPDFFAADRYPSMRFVSHRITPAGNNTYLLEGKMTIKDVTRDMQLEFTFLGERENPFKKNQIVGGFETRFTLDRLAFNVGSGKFFDMGVVDKSVHVLVSVEAVRPK